MYPSRRKQLKQRFTELKGVEKTSVAAAGACRVSIAPDKTGCCTTAGAIDCVCGGTPVIPEEGSGCIQIVLLLLLLLAGVALLAALLAALGVPRRSLSPAILVLDDRDDRKGLGPKSSSSSSPSWSAALRIMVEVEVYSISNESYFLTVSVAAMVARSIIVAIIFILPRAIDARTHERAHHICRTRTQ
jgi:hypothetical protein